MMQVALRTCNINQVATAFECDILSVYPDGKPGFGSLVRLNADSIGEVIEGCFVDRLSQEHGILRVTPAFFNEFHVGDTIGILPMHS